MLIFPYTLSWRKLRDKSTTAESSNLAGNARHPDLCLASKWMWTPELMGSRKNTMWTKDQLAVDVVHIIQYDGITKLISFELKCRWWTYSRDTSLNDTFDITKQKYGKYLIATTKIRTNLLYRAFLSSSRTKLKSMTSMDHAWDVMRVNSMMPRTPLLLHDLKILVCSNRRGMTV